MAKIADTHAEFLARIAKLKDAADAAVGTPNEQAAKELFDHAKLAYRAWLSKL